MEAILYFVVPAALLLGLLLWKRSGLISSDEAKRLLNEGATVVDVRTPAEFSQGHLKSALNIPLDQLEHQVGATVPGKDNPLLVHCFTGTRSAMACARLKSLGYDRVHNLGGLNRARHIIQG
jgi:rhodanese-related sulfurtransferase